MDENVINDLSNFFSDDFVLLNYTSLSGGCINQVYKIETNFGSYVLKFNKDVIEERLILLSKYIEIKDQTFDGIMNWVLELRNDLSIPHTLKDLNVEFNYETI